MTSHPVFEAWHDFFVLLSTAAATLVGLMFVAASVGTSVFTQERQAGLRTFLSPTVVAFSVVLAASLVAMVPVSDRRMHAAVLVGMGAAGVVYSWRVWRRMVEHGIVDKIDLEDRTWYTMIPAACYALLAAAGIGIDPWPQPACFVIAAGASLLLVAGIRNAWDMTTWVVLQRND